MSPAQFHDQHAKKDTVPSLSSPSSSSFPPLQINKDSHFIKKSSPSSSSSSSSSLSLASCVANVTNKSQQQQQQRHPVIIYTHSPKIIHTHPKDFMALVQKLTGVSRSDRQQQQDDHHQNQNQNQNQNHQLPPPSKLLIDPNNHDNRKKINKGAGNCMMINDDNESTSVVTDDNNGSNNTITTTLGEAQVNSCFVPPPIFDPPNPCFNSIPFFNPNSTDFLCTAQPFYNFSDSLLFMPNIRSSLSSSTLEGMKELPDF